MKLIEDIRHILHPFKNAVVAIGNFDGVHIGHQALFNAATEKADAIGGAAVAITFEPHPIQVLKGAEQLPRITDFEQKKRLINRTGIDALICIPFTAEFANISAHSFIIDLLIEKVGMQACLIGADFTFGKNRSGDVKLLEKYAKQYGFEVMVADWIRSPKNNNIRISSTSVRQLISAGKIEAAQAMLGRPYQIVTTPNKGCNWHRVKSGLLCLDIQKKNILCPQPGCYAVTVEHKEKVYAGTAVINTQSLLRKRSPFFNVYISKACEIDPNGEVRVSFGKKLLRSRLRFNPPILKRSEPQIQRAQRAALMAS